MTFASNKTLVAHQKAGHAGPRVLKCGERGCRMYFALESQLLWHHKTCHGKGRGLRCGVPGCGQEFADELVLAEHRKNGAHQELKPAHSSIQKRVRRSSAPPGLEGSSAEARPEAAEPPNRKRARDVSPAPAPGEASPSAAPLKETPRDTRARAPAGDGSTDGAPAAEPRQPKVRVEDPGRAWKCDAPGCGRRYALNKNMVAHRRLAHERRRDYKCGQPGCGQEFAYKLQFVNHWKTFVHRAPEAALLAGLKCARLSSSPSELAGRSADAELEAGELLGRKRARDASPASELPEASPSSTPVKEPPVKEPPRRAL